MHDTAPGSPPIRIAHIAANEQELLATMGVTVQPPSGRLMYWIDATWQWWREVGFVVVSTTGIEVWPHSGASEADMEVLRGAACEAFCTPPSAADHWVRVGARWECSIWVPADR